MSKNKSPRENPVDNLPIEEQLVIYTDRRVKVSKKLASVHSLNNRFEEGVRGKKTSLFLETARKGFERQISELDSHVKHLDKKIDSLTTTLTNNGGEQTRTA